MRDLNLQWVIEPSDINDGGFVGRAFVCGAATIDDENIGNYEALAAEYSDANDGAELDPDAVPEMDEHELFERFTGHSVPRDLDAEFDNGELFLVAQAQEKDELAARLAKYGGVSFNACD